MTDGGVCAAALKEVPYTTYEQQFAANAELAGLRDAEGCPHLGQCLAVFVQQSPDGTEHRLCILLE